LTSHAGSIDDVSVFVEVGHVTNFWGGQEKQRRKCSGSPRGQSPTTPEQQPCSGKLSAAKSTAQQAISIVEHSVFWALPVADAASLPALGFL
jgi:hypothetical protein